MVLRPGNLRRRTLRWWVKRAALALAALAAGYACGWAAPRWWATRPREYPEARAAALSIAAEVFGQGALDAGIVTIP